MKLSEYAFNTYGQDAKLYNGIHDLEERNVELAGRVAILSILATRALAEGWSLAEYETELWRRG